MNDKVKYFPNVFEYLRTDPDLDSVASFLHGYSIYEFDAEQSVPGGIVNGQTVYLVRYLGNNHVIAHHLIEDEDSE